MECWLNGDRKCGENCIAYRIEGTTAGYDMCLILDVLAGSLREVEWHYKKIREQQTQKDAQKV